jgi:hypothetical protein
MERRKKGRCEACGKTRMVSRDFDPDTRAPRGMLCAKCRDFVWALEYLATHRSRSLDAIESTEDTRSTCPNCQLPERIRAPRLRIRMVQGLDARPLARPCEHDVSLVRANIFTRSGAAEPVAWSSEDRKRVASAGPGRRRRAA